MAQFISEEALRATLIREVNTAMLEAAEPYIEEALKKIEQKMRQQLAASLISLVESNINIERFGQDIRVTIRRFEQ